MKDISTATTTHPIEMRMRLSQILAGFLIGPRFGRPFCTGDWLRSLSDADLNALIALGDHWCWASELNSRSLADYLGVLVQAVAAETGKYRVSFKPKELMDLGNALLDIARMEHSRRLGHIKVRGKLRIFPNKKVSLVVTEEGMQATGLYVNSI